MNWLIVFPMVWVSFTLAVDPSICNFPLATKFYHEISQPEVGNSLLSPYSLLSVLGLLQYGGKGRVAAREIYNAFFSDKDPEVIADCFLEIQELLKKEDLHLANKVYVRQDLKINATFEKIATKVYGAEIENIDFANNEEAADTINQWVEGKTENTIKNVFSPEDLNAKCAIVIVNALQFKGNWSKRFKSVGKKDFFVDDESHIEVDMMQLDQVLTYYENTFLDAKLVDLPLNETGYTFTIAIPNKKNGVRTIEQNLEAVFKTEQPRKSELIRLFLPKFKITSKINLKGTLQRLGVKTIFTSDSDFTGLVDVPVHIDEVFQKAFISVNENGVEVAAATDVAGLERSGLEPKMVIKVDHPFFFFVTKKRHIIYLGKIVNLLM